MKISRNVNLLRCLPCLLASSDDFFYTSQGKHPVVAGIDDGANFLEVCEAMSMLGIYSDMQRMIWRILASVLHLGDVTISKSGKSGDGCHVKVNQADESKGLAFLMVDS